MKPKMKGVFYIAVILIMGTIIVIQHYYLTQKAPQQFTTAEEQVYKKESANNSANARYFSYLSGHFGTYGSSYDQDLNERIRQYIEFDRQEMQIRGLEESMKDHVEIIPDLSDEEVARMEMQNLEPFLDPAIEHELESMRIWEESQLH